MTISDRHKEPARLAALAAAARGALAGFSAFIRGIANLGILNYPPA